MFLHSKFTQPLLVIVRDCKRLLRLHVLIYSRSNLRMLLMCAFQHLLYVFSPFHFTIAKNTGIHHLLYLLCAFFPLQHLLYLLNITMCLLSPPAPDVCLLSLLSRL